LYRVYAPVFLHIGSYATASG